MKVLFTGATGVIGRLAVPRLIEQGHEVTGVARSQDGRKWLESVGAYPIEVDLFDPASVAAAVAGHEAVVHFATAIPSQAAMTQRAAWRMNDRLRDEATGHLVGAARRHGVGTFVQESIALAYADGGDEWIDESSPVETVWEVLDSALTAEAHVTAFSEGGGNGVVLRMSRLYGPGRVSGEYLAAVAARRVPQVGAGRNWVSHLHVEDAASAIEAALSAAPGVYNVTDDEPATTGQALSTVADLLGAPRPRRVPGAVARVAAGPAAALLSVSHRVSNRRFRDATGWSPKFPSVLTGWKSVVEPETRSVRG